MPRPPIAAGEYYHVYNRGVLKQPIFFESRDYQRFIRNLYEFNDTHPIPDRRTHRPSRSGREPIVSILAWCLMPNHFHLLVSPVENDGLSLFMNKMADGYTKYLNKKYQRSGHLFEGRYQLKLVENDSYALQLSKYIHLNPKELIQSNNHEATLSFIDNYRWSSYPNWLGKKSFSSILDWNLLQNVFGPLKMQVLHPTDLEGL
ncbi:hypothetical protein EPN90_01750 [Patescibacteria group bacterium]|nr:MAG: hypothetical protein EPN90_01750 [Patescibacteria group bacterium]